MSTNPIRHTGSAPFAATAVAPASPSQDAAGASLASDGIAIRPSSRGNAFPDFTAARDWRPGSSLPSGVEANEQITKGYTQLDKRMTKYFGFGELPNWTTFGKFASRTAGQQIKELEAIIRAFDGRQPQHLLPLVGDMHRYPLRRVKQGLTMLQNLHAGPDFLKNVKAMRQALVFGNTEIMKDIGPAYETFLSAVEQGQDGVAAMRAAGYGQAPKDPQGFILQAFEKYAEAKALGPQIIHHIRALRGDTAAQAKGVEALYQRQRALMVQGNMLLGFHEQYLSLQRPEIFENPAVEKLMAAFSKDMAIHDANGSHALLESGGNWANFADRMGLREATPEDDPEAIFTLRDNQGETLRYVAREGASDTIAGYFEKYTQYGLDGLDLIGSKPGASAPGPLDRLFARLPWRRG